MPWWWWCRCSPRAGCSTRVGVLDDDVVAVRGEEDPDGWSVVVLWMAQQVSEQVLSNHRRPVLAAHEGEPLPQLGQEVRQTGRGLWTILETRSESAPRVAGKFVTAPVVRSRSPVVIWWASTALDQPDVAARSA